MPESIDRSPPASGSQPADRRRSSPHGQFVAGVGLIVVATTLAYVPALQGGFVFDDDKLLTANSLIRAGDGLWRNWFTTEAQDYWPVTNSSFWLEWRLWGTQAAGYHVTNLILHVASALLLWKILQMLAIPGAFLAALLFAVHPVNVESVAWIAQRKNVLAMLFFLLSILWYLRQEEETRRKGAEETQGNSSVGGWYWLSLTAFVLAMLSKGSVAVLPFILLLLVWWQRQRITGRDLARTGPFFVVAVALAGVNVWFQTHGADVVVRNASFAERLCGAGAAVWFYLSKALLPIDLVFIYPQWHIQSGDVLWGLPLVAAVVVTAVLWSRRHSAQANWVRPLLFAWIYFGVALLPVLGFVDVGFMRFSLVADHYQHLAIISVVTLVAAGWSIWHRRTIYLQLTSIIVAIALVSALMLLSWQQTKLYAGAIALYQDTLLRNPECWVAHNNLGETFLEAGRIREAESHFKEALRLKSDYHDAYNNLGNALLKTGRLPEAIEKYEQALRLKPDYPEPYANLALAYALMQRRAEAVAAAEKGLALAQTQSNTLLAQRIEAWLISYRAGQNMPATAPP